MAVKSKRKSKNNSKSKNNNKSKKICYDGIGATKKYHTKKEFLALMNKTFKRACSRFIGAKQCSSCKKRRREARKFIKNIKKSKKNPKFKMSNEEFKVFDKNQDKLEQDCRKCSNKNKKKCSLNEYMEDSGASYNC